MNITRKFSILALAVLAVAVLSLSSCTSIAAWSTPSEIKVVPTTQSFMLESAIDSINANDSNWVDANGNILRAPMLGVLGADKNAWSELDRFYNADAAPAPTE